MQIANDFFSFLYTLDNGQANPVSLFLFVGSWLRDFVVNLITFQWVGWLIHLPQTRPMLSDEMFRERLILVPDLGSSFAMFNIFEGPATLGLNKFGIGLLNSFFLLLPVTLVSALNIRRLILQGVAPWVVGTLGIIGGEILFIGAVIFGCQFLIARWHFLGPASYFIGLLVALWAFYKMGAKQKVYLLRKDYIEMFLIGFGLSWVEQTTMFEKLQYFSWSAEQTNLLQRFNSTSAGQDFWIHSSYLLGLTVGCLSLTALAAYIMVHYLEIHWIVDPFAPVPVQREIRLGMAEVYADGDWNPLYWFHYGYPRRDVASFYFALVMAFVSLPYHAPDYLLTSPWQFKPRSEYLRQSPFTDIKNDAKYVFDTFRLDEVQWKEANFFVDELSWRKKLKHVLRREFFLQRALSNEAMNDTPNFIYLNAQAEIEATSTDGWVKWVERYAPPRREMMTTHMELNLGEEDNTASLIANDAAASIGDLITTDSGDPEANKPDGPTQDSKSEDPTNPPNVPHHLRLGGEKLKQPPGMGFLQAFGKNKQQKPPTGRNRARLLFSTWDELEATRQEDFSVLEDRTRRKREYYGSRSVAHPDIQTREDWMRYKRQLNSDRSAIPDLRGVASAVNFQQAGERKAMIPPSTQRQWREIYDARRMLWPTSKSHPASPPVSELAAGKAGLGPQWLPYPLLKGPDAFGPPPADLQDQILRAGFVRDPALMERSNELRASRKLYSSIEKASENMLKPRPELIDAIRLKMNQGNPEQKREGNVIAPLWSMSAPPLRKLMNSSMRRRDIKESWRHQNTFYSVFGFMGLSTKSYMNLFPPTMLTLRVMADQVLDGQPKRQFVTDEQKARLQYQKAALSRYHRSLRSYRESVNAAVISQLGFAKSRLNYVYRQQYKSSYRVVRRLFFADSKRWNNPYNEPIFEYGQLLPYDPSVSFRHEELPVAEPGDDQRIPLDSINAPLYLAWDDSLRKTILTTGRRARTSISPTPIEITIPKEVTQTWKYRWDPRFVWRSSRVLYDPELPNTVPVEFVQGGPTSKSTQEVYEGPQKAPDVEEGDVGMNRKAFKVVDPIRSRYRIKG